MAPPLSEPRPRPTRGHEIDRLRALADVPPRHQPAPSLQLTAADVAAADALLRSVHITPPFVALAPGSRWGSKRWPHYAALARQLVMRTDVILVGGADDATLADTIIGAIPVSPGLPDGRGVGRRKVVNACGKLTLRQSAALLQKADVLVTNDSAPLHFAQAVGTPTVAIFGPTIPVFGFGPRGPRDVAVGIDGLACRPCSAHGPHVCPLGHHRCMQSLRVEDVLHAVGRPAPSIAVDDG
jgi:heptosyltransferase-2